MMKRTRALVVASLALLLSGCVSVPDGVIPVSGFELEPYLGKWHEIARLDHRFERGMTDVTAEYSLRDDGGVRVLNSGLVVDKGSRKQAEGKAYFVRDEDTGFLKVSFFGPFYGAYIIFELGPEQGGQYQYSMVSGPNKSYLWLLARTPVVSDELLQSFKKRAAEAGFDTSALIIDNG